MNKKLDRMDRANNTGFTELKQMMGKFETTLGTVHNNVEYLQINMERNRVEALHEMEVHKKELKEDINVHACQCHKPTGKQFYTNDGNKSL